MRGGSLLKKNIVGLIAYEAENPGEYTEIGKGGRKKATSAYQDVDTKNPYKSDIKDQLSGLNTDVSYSQVSGPGAFDMQRLEGAMGNVDQQTQQAYMAAQGYNPMAAYGQFQQMAPGLQQLATGNYAPLTQGLNQQAARQAELGMNKMASQYAGAGALSSGAGQAAVSQAAMQPYMDVQNQQQQLQAQLAGNLMQRGLGEAFQAQRYGTEAGLQAAGLGMEGAGLGMQGAQMDIQAQKARKQMAQQAALANQKAQLRAQQLENQALLEQAGIYSEMGGQSLQAQMGQAQGVADTMMNRSLQYNPTGWEKWGAPMTEAGIGLVTAVLGGAAESPGMASTGTSMMGSGFGASGKSGGYRRQQR